MYAIFRRRVKEKWSSNTKTAIIVAFNTFLLTGIVLKWANICVLFLGYPKLVSIIKILILLIALSSTVSLFFVFKTINPFLKSPEHPTQYTSSIFFGHVYKFKPDDYAKHIKEINTDVLINDLYIQTNILAGATNEKFNNIKKSITAIIFVQIPILIIILIMKISIIISGLL